MSSQEIALALALATVERLGAESPLALLVCDPHMLRFFCEEFVAVRVPAFFVRPAPKSVGALGVRYYAPPWGAKALFCGVSAHVHAVAGVGSNAVAVFQRSHGTFTQMAVVDSARWEAANTSRDYVSLTEGSRLLVRGLASSRLFACNGRWMACVLAAVRLQRGSRQRLAAFACAPPHAPSSAAEVALQGIEIADIGFTEGNEDVLAVVGIRPSQDGSLVVSALLVDVAAATVIFYTNRSFPELGTRSLRLMEGATELLVDDGERFLLLAVETLCTVDVIKHSSGVSVPYPLEVLAVGRRTFAIHGFPVGSSSTYSVQLWSFNEHGHIRTIAGVGNVAASKGVLFIKPFNERKLDALDGESGQLVRRFNLGWLRKDDHDVAVFTTAL